MDRVLFVGSLNTKKSHFDGERIKSMSEDIENTTDEMFSICFAITVCDEHEEFSILLDNIIPFLAPQDEIIVQYDIENVTENVKNTISKYSEKISKSIGFPLNKDFGNFKNNLSKNTTKDYIFQIDADEIPSPYLLKNLHKIITCNKSIDLIRLPRVNIMIENDSDFLTWENETEI